MDLHHDIWLILLLSLLSKDIISGPGMQICWYQSTHGAYLNLVTEPFSRLLRNCGTVFQWRSETFRPSHLLNELSKHTFLRQLFNWLIHNSSAGRFYYKRLVFHLERRGNEEQLSGWTATVNNIYLVFIIHHSPLWYVATEIKTKKLISCHGDHQRYLFSFGRECSFFSEKKKTVKVCLLVLRCQSHC